MRKLSAPQSITPRLHAFQISRALHRRKHANPPKTVIGRKAKKNRRFACPSWARATPIAVKGSLQAAFFGSPSGGIAGNGESRWTGECRKPCQPSRLDSSNSACHQRITCIERRSMFTFMLFIVLLLVCLVGSLVGWGWLISIASREGENLIAIGCFLVPPLVFLYALTNYQAAKTPFWLLTGSVSILGTLFLLA